ncbi:hypothetical protein PVT71_13670 [Salipiger sp. H15]|uniref:Uncharacterized protein n=1 Tax=Alloyangia sp. H15 TaxID=3029062 RepID=A0AAU8AFJ2_9RHOB
MFSGLWQKVLSWSWQHLPTVFATFLSMLFVFLVAGFFIEQKSFLSRLIAPVAGFFSGAIIGGGWAATVGGIGVAAMGTAFAVPAFAVVGLGVLAGGVIGGFGGVTFELVAFLRNPSSFDVQYAGLFGVLIAAIAIFFPIRAALRFLLHRRA